MTASTESDTERDAAVDEVGNAALVIDAWVESSDDNATERIIATVDCELKADAARRLALAVLRMERFLLREASRHLIEADPTQILARSLCADAQRLLRDSLADHAGEVKESTLRSAYRLIAALANLAAWSAPAAQESCTISSFPHAAARDVVSYARFGCAETAEQESAYASQLGFDPAHARLLLTSSGMTAYALIESFLLRDVLVAQDRVVMHPGVYFETQERLRSLPFLVLHTAGGDSQADLLTAIRAHQPSVVFVDPLTNTGNLRLLDLPQLLDAADHACVRETWFVIDGTLLSGGFDPFAGAPRRRVRVLYYESGCKYLQFGMDLGPAGIVVVEQSLAERFEHLRRGLGAVVPESVVLPRGSRFAYLAFLRAQTASAAAAARGTSQFLQGQAAVISAVFPTLSTHPDHQATSCYPHAGGIVTFRFAEARHNSRVALERFIDTLIAAARRRDIPLTAGVSFGFRVPRIGAAWSSYDADAAFLRLSAGVVPERGTQLGILIAKCARDFVIQKD